jgi:hypothetical protein
VQADRHVIPVTKVDVVLASEQIDVGACMPMRHRDRATANGRIHPRDPGQLAVPCWPSHEGPAARVCGVARSTPWTSSRRATRLSGHLARPDSRLWRQAIGSSRHICFASRVAVAKLRLDGTPTPCSRVARMTKRPDTTGAGKSASLMEARMRDGQ